MKVTLSNPRGFCAGVNMAIDSLNYALEQHGAPIYVFHEIVHNRHVVEDFESRGVRFIQSIDQVPEGSVVMYSAHGVSPAIREQSKRAGLKAIDATCPLVTKVHLETRKFAEQGYQVILIGHAGHDEVIGTLGEAPSQIQLIENETDVEKLSFPPDAKLAFVTQTTLSVTDVKRVIAALKSRYPQIVGPKKEDICYATQNRQDAVRALAEDADLVLVVGSQNSSNSLRLVEMARACDREAYLIDSAAEIRSEWLSGKQAVVVTAGASAPESIVQECIRFLNETYQAEIAEAPGRKETVFFGRRSQI